MERNGKNEASDNLTEIGREEFLEDVFGFNIRSVRSIWTLIKNPAAYFKAARIPNWQDKFTPSIRLMLGIAAITMALQFFWAKPYGGYVEYYNTAYQNALDQGMAAAGHPVDVSQIDFRDNIVATLERMNIYYLPLYIIILSLFAWIYRAWGEKLPFIIRQRFVFAIGIPASIFGLIWLILTSLFSAKSFEWLVYSQAPLLIILIFITALRGPFGHMRKGEAIGRSLVTTLCFIICAIGAQLIAFIIAFQIVGRPELETIVKGLLTQ